MRLDAEGTTSILIVDDSPMARRMLVKALPAQWRVSIAQAGNGREALDAYRKGRVDVMFLDLTMPDMDGYQVLETLQKEDLNCFVIVVSADIQPQARERLVRLGAAAFLKKPVDTAEVAAVLHEYGFLP